MTYQLKLNVFEGPMDLLLFLIRKEEIDIYDIPISKIVKEYLEYLEFMRNLNLEIAGDFIFMAATLMKIKAQMLLPVYIGEDEEYEDPRDELVRNLIEYQKFKEVSRELKDMETESMKLFPRVMHEVINENDIEEGTYEKSSMFDLMSAFYEIMNKDREAIRYYINQEEFTLEEQIDYILVKLKKMEKISFYNLINELKEKIKRIVTFLAILELAKRKMISIFQSDPLKDIWLLKGKEFRQDQV